MENLSLVPPEGESPHAAPVLKPATEPLWGAPVEELGVFGSLVESLRDVFFPRKLPPLVLESKPIAVVDRMAVKRDPNSTAVAVVLHALVILLIAFLVGLAVGFAPIGYALFKRSKRFDKFQEGLPEALDLIVNALRAGHSLIAAMGLVARECADPVGSEFKACFEEQNYGLELTTALDNLIVRVPLQDLKIVATAITIQKESGGNLAEVLDKTAHVIRERFRLKRQVRTHTAQGRLTGIILTLLPLGLGIVLFFLNPAQMSLLWTTPVGIKLLWAGSAGIILGGFIINRIVDMEV